MNQNQLIDDILEEFGAKPITLAEARTIVSNQQEPIKLPKLKCTGNGSFTDIMFKRTIASTAQRMPWYTLTWTIKDAPKTMLSLFSCCIDDEVTAVILDIENGVCMQRFLEAIDDFAYIAYYSASSTIEKQRFRVVIPLSKPVPAEDFDFCKPNLEEAFGSMPDIHSFESRRFFFVPSRYVGQYREENEIHTHQGLALDFYETTGFSPKDKLKRAIDKMKKSSGIKHKDVIDDERVQYYLTTDFPKMTGNGDSASSLYTAIVTCLANDDEASLDEVLDKARSERWTDRELDRKVKDAKKFLGI